MTLDEAIEMYTSNAEYERTHGSLQGCMDFKQLAEWLRELKQLRQAVEDIRREIENQAARFNKRPEISYDTAYSDGLYYAPDIIDKYKAESEG